MLHLSIFFFSQSLFFSSAALVQKKKSIPTLTQGSFQETWREVVKENPIKEDENIKVTPIFKNEDSSHLIIQIRDREKPHIHETHDLTVVVKRGKGILHLGKNPLPMSHGDIAFIPKGVVHYFVNEDSKPSVAYVIFTPFYDGKDIKEVLQD